MSSWGATASGHLWTARPRSRGNRHGRFGEIASGKSLVLPAPARLLPLLPTVDSCQFSGTATTAKGRGLSPPASAGRPYRWRRKDRLLHFDRGTGRFQVLLELGSFVLRNAFLDRATGFGQVLGFLQAQAGDRADHLDDLDLLLAGGLQVDRELGLLFGGGGTGGGRTSGNGHRGGGGHAELLFHRLDQLHHL